MKFTILASSILPLLLAQRAVATWGDAQAFSCPANSDNQCSDDQKSGFDWSKAQIGAISTYGQFSMTGFVCANQFSPGTAGRKRSIQVRSDFNKKCIQGKAPKASGDGPSQNSPRISCGTEKKMSITKMQVSVDQDTDLDFHYDMPDGSICKKTQRCKATGTVVTNDQCGGAKTVRVQVNKKGKNDCEFGIHKIDFDCNPPVGKPPTTTTEKTTEKTKDKTTEKTTMTTEKTTEKTKTTKKTKETTTTMFMPPMNTTTSMEMKTTKVKCEECDKTTTMEMMTTTMEQPPMMTTTMMMSSAVPDAPPPVDAPCPPVLPRCMNTWMMKIPACKSNSDITCLCPQPEYIQKVQDCVSAWGGSDQELQGAYSYLVGICAKYVPQNPGLCTNVPPTITLVPNPMPPPQTVYNTMGSMIQTMTIPMTVPMTLPPPDQCTTIAWTAEGPSGVMNSGVVTVPKVAFTTGNPMPYTTMDSNGQQVVTTSDAGVGLVPYVSATPTNPLPLPTGPLNMTAGVPTSTGSVGQFTGAAVAINANMAAAGLFAVAAFLV